MCNLFRSKDAYNRVRLVMDYQAAEHMHCGVCKGIYIAYDEW